MNGLDAVDFTWMVLPGLATGLGGLGLLVIRRRSNRILDAMLGFTAGVMLAATAFSLLVPALDIGSLGEVLLGFMVGAGALFALDELLPHAHPRFREHGHLKVEEAQATRRATLLLSALTIHNVPEGLAVGAAFAAGGTELGIPLALAIGIQNIPEGFAAAAPLLETGTPKRRAAGIAFMTGLAEPPAALVAYGFLELASALLPIGLGFAAGAMLFVIVDELIPESHVGGFEREASLALIAGFALMMALDNMFG